MLHTKTVTLPVSGDKVTIDLSKMTMREFRGLIDRNQPDEEEDRIMSAITGTEFPDLNFADNKYLAKSAIEFAVDYARHATDTESPKA